MYTWKLSSYALRRFNSGYGNGTSKLALVLQHCSPRTQGRGKLGSYRRRISSWFREQGTQTAQACKKQFEFVAAQRIRRYIQIFHLYTRIWDEVALREFMRLWRLRLAKNAKNFLISAAGVSIYNWDRNRITDEEINRYNREIEGIYRLRDSTVVCTKCHLRIVIDTIQPDIKYCKCSGVQPSDASDENSDGNWQPFIERQDMLIWRKVVPDSGGLFAYKVYGSFSDVTAEDFLQVQIDVDYRKQWDPTAQELQIVETDPKSKPSVNHSTDVIHWEMIWPKLFSNRDYVYQRRWIMDREKGLVVIVSRVTEHPNVPEKRGIYRVRTYWSYMVIKPCTEFHEPGIEFGLTYFDDPGVSVPSTVTAWVALRGLPDFLIRMRQASKDYQKYKLMKKNAPDSNHLTLSEEDVSKQQIDVEDKLKNNKKFMRDHKDQQDDSTNDTNKLDLTHDVQQENDLTESENKDTTSAPKEEQAPIPDAEGERVSAQKKKGKKIKKQKETVDEYQLRRNLREQAKMTKSADQETAMPTQVVEPQYSEDIRIGGIEGGATHSILIILDGKGAKLTEIKGPHTNHWVIGKDETAARLSAMIERGKQMLDIPENVPLDCVALTLSGCEEETINRQIVETLLEKYPQSAKDYVISSDTLGSLRTGLESGGIVLIAGTGSNALLMNPDGKIHSCGGWGHIMGDEGGAYWIAYRACKYVFDDIDGFIEAPESISYVWPAMKSYFNVTDRRSILPYVYANFDKSIIAGFAKEIAIGCERGDPLCLKIFEEAGQLLAKHINAVSKKAHNDLKLAHGGLKVICVGSVWKSWKFMKNGFMNEIHNRNVVDELSLLHLTTSSALGACYLAAEKINCSFIKPYDSNVETFFHYKRDHYPETQKTEHSIELKNYMSDYNSAQVHGNEEST